MSDALEEAKTAAADAQAAVDSGAFADRGDEFESTNTGVRQAAAELQQAETTTRPPPPRPVDELASPHSITSSARASSEGGTSRLSALAALRLMASSSLVGCWTGKSAGFSPRSTRST